jgi:hypothetical protein
MGKFSLNQKVPTHLAFMLILILSFLVAWYSLNAADEIIKNAKESSSFNLIEKQKLIPTK